VENDKRIKKVLDFGHVRLVDSMGDDKRIVDAARVSYQNGTKVTSDDRNLIRHLLRNSHTTPFEKVRFEFHVKCPIFIARQWFRHRMGSFNEISGRYSILSDEFYIPEKVRGQSKTNKQGSSDDVIKDIPLLVDEEGNTITITPQEFIEEHSENAYATYISLINEGVSRELARAVLPLNIYTEFYWTVDLWNLMNFLRLRIDSHAQYEIQVYGKAILDLINSNCQLTLSMEAFQDYILDSPRLTKFEIEIIDSLIKEIKMTSISLESTSEILTRLIEEHPSMSKREKTESKLFSLLGGK
jgi:thymidylate synthase (FAD)